MATTQKIQSLIDDIQKNRYFLPEFQRGFRWNSEQVKKYFQSLYRLYLEKHRHRILNYDYYQAEGICSIGSGAVESAIKQIDRRVQVSGAQWKAENVPQVLAHRTAYLNELFSLKG